MSVERTQPVSIRTVLALMVCVVSCGGVASATEYVVTVAPLFLLEPSTVQETTELDSVGVGITEPSALVPGETVYLEVWFQARGPNGIASAVMNVNYETNLLDTTVEQVQVSLQWTDLRAPVRVVDDALGLITDVGGASVVGYGLAPNWAKLATIEFDVIETPGAFTLAACTVDGGPLSGFGMVGVGAVDGIDYRCACREDSNLAALGTFAGCLSGPEGVASSDCACADLDQDTYVDLRDFAAFQIAFLEG